jgi:hypothetical protein
MAAAAAEPGALICGEPRFDASIPRHRLYLRYLTHAMVWLNTLSFDIPDSMCGLRVYLGCGVAGHRSGASRPAHGFRC